MSSDGAPCAVWHHEGVRRRANGPLLVVGALLVLAGLALLLAARFSIGTSRWVYVSEMGAPDLPTAGAFEAALLLDRAMAFGALDIEKRLHFCGPQRRRIRSPAQAGQGKAKGQNECGWPQQHGEIAWKLPW